MCIATPGAFDAAYVDFDAAANIALDMFLAEVSLFVDESQTLLWL
jgi:hypothetical protein